MKIETLTHSDKQAMEILRQIDKLNARRVELVRLREHIDEKIAPILEETLQLQEQLKQLEQ